MLTNWNWSEVFTQKLNILWEKIKIDLLTSFTRYRFKVLSGGGLVNLRFHAPVLFTGLIKRLKLLEEFWFKMQIDVLTFSTYKEFFSVFILKLVPWRMHNSVKRKEQCISRNITCLYKYTNVRRPKLGKTDGELFSVHFVRFILLGESY